MLNAALFLLILIQSCVSIPKTINPQFHKSLFYQTLNSVPPAALNPHPIEVAFQGEPGAYSEKASRVLLGPRITTVPYESFEDAFQAVASREVDYAVVPIENSLGGSIHTNFDLLL